MDVGLNCPQPFNPVESRPELLEHTLVGRRNLVNLLEELARESASSGNKHQRLIIGPRGSGKTHALKVLHNRLSADRKLHQTLETAFLCEDEYGVATFLDWIIRILRSLIKWETEEAAHLEKEIENLKHVHPDNQEKAAVRILLSHIKNKTLLIIVENIGNIFHSKKGFGKVGQRKLRDLVQQRPQFSIIASNQALFRDIQNEDMPFLNFFTIMHLKKLSLEETHQFLASLAYWDYNSTLLGFLEKPEGGSQLRAIYDLTAGNHRLLVAFYQFLSADSVNRLSEAFMKTINNLIPYYQGQMESLSAQQQKIVQHLCQVRVPINVKTIASNCFISQGAASKQMNILVKLKYVDAISSGRETFYEISEPLLRFCIESKENRGGPIKLFVDFLENAYSFKEFEQEFTYHPPNFTEARGYFNPGPYPLPGSDAPGMVAENPTAPEYHSGREVEEDVNTLLMEASFEKIRDYFQNTLAESGTQPLDDPLLTSIPDAVFHLLREHEQVENKRFEFIDKLFNDKWKEKPEMALTLKFLNVGFRHLKMKEKNVLLRLTKEERAAFNRFVLDQKKGCG